MSEKMVTTPDGRFAIASGTRLLAAVLTDIFAPATTLLCMVAILEKLGISLPSWLSAAFGLLVLFYAFLARSDLVYSIGNWGFGLKRYAFSTIEEYSGSGYIYVVIAAGRILLWRTVVVVAYVAISTSILEMLT